MILRRVIAHFRKQEWTAIAIDFLIVVVGVFIGIQVANWNEARADREREKQIIVDMLADLEIDAVQYTNAAAFAARRVAAANASLTGAGLPPIEFDYTLPNEDLVEYAFSLADEKTGEPAQRDRLWTDIVVGYFPTPSTSTFDLIVGSGEISIFRDRALVRAIQRYRNLTNSVVMQNEKLLAIRKTAMDVGAEYGLSPYADLGESDYFELIARTPELAAQIRVMATFTIFHSGEIESADEQAKLLKARLEAYIGEAP